jgi:hypothetical protein
MSGIMGLRTSAFATAIGLGLAVMAPTIALSNEVDRSVPSETESGIADLSDTSNFAAKSGTIDYVFEVGLSDRLEIKAAVETFVWGLSNQQSSAVWLIAPEVEQTKFGSEAAAYTFFSKVHPPLVHAKSIAFDNIVIADNLPIANIYVTDAAGLQWRASFVMAREAAGGWKIVGCRLLPAPGDLV